LQTLILKENVLTDEGVRKLTVRKRMFKEVNSPLETLDLSDNTGITEKSLQFLGCLTKLTMINTSNTSISRKVTRQSSAKWIVLPSEYTRLGEENVAGKILKNLSHARQSNSEVKTILVSRNLFSCPHWSELEFTHCDLNNKRKIFPAFDHTAMSGDQLQAKNVVKKNHLSMEEKIEMSSLSDNPAHDNIHEVSEMVSYYLPSEVQRVKNGSLKRTHSALNNTSHKNSRPSNIMGQHEGEDAIDSLVAQYQSSLSDHIKRPKRSLLEVLDEYM
ncbi:leucine-rich repeat-containing protein 42, partial [Elysia marginata]